MNHGDTEGMSESGRAVYVIANLLKENDQLRQERDGLISVRDNLIDEITKLQQRILKKDKRANFGLTFKRDS